MTGFGNFFISSSAIDKEKARRIRENNTPRAKKQELF
jgi:hypothetical protein